MKDPSIASQMPLRFENGAHFDSLRAHCNKCKELVPDEELRGTVTHPFPHVYIVQALGHCRLCELVTPISYRLHDDMSLVGRTPTGEWGRWAPTYPLLTRIKQQILSLVQDLW